MGRMRRGSPLAAPSWSLARILLGDGVGGAIVAVLTSTSTRLFQCDPQGGPAAGWTEQGLLVNAGLAVDDGKEQAGLAVASDGAIYLAWTEGTPGDFRNND